MAEARMLKAKTPVPSRDVGDKKMRTRNISPSGPPVVRRLLHGMVMAVFLTIVAAPALLPKFSVVDNDIWLHLKVGDWIVEHSSVPHTGILSRTTADRPWAAYSWFYELLLSTLPFPVPPGGRQHLRVAAYSRGGVQHFLDDSAAFRHVLESMRFGYFDLRRVSVPCISQAGVFFHDVVHSDVNPAA